METGLLRDRDWAPLDGALCRVTTLTPLGFTKGMPYASVEVESTLLAEPTTAFVTHKLDFVIMWTKRHLKRRAKLVSWFMPRMWVSLCRANTFELLTDQPWEEPQGPERDGPFVIAEWKPDVME